ncbi:MAG TPA: C25 family cysteine peptidase [Chitinophagaceae bacterium]|nr:C25 family cysteine peptidase [Chitinophagaceae bacterium]
MFTTVQTGVLGALDYLEFWGEMNDGKPDNVLYRDSLYQLTNKWSLQTDTAALFLTVNPGAANLRYIPANNDVAGNVLPAEPFFMYTSGKYWKDRLGQGWAQVVGENVYSSAYDRGEGWTSVDITKGATLTYVMNNLHVYTGAGAPPEANFTIHASGYNGNNPRVFRVKINGDSILGMSMDYFEILRAQKQIPLSLINSGSATIEITNQSIVPGSDRMVVAQVEINYPRQFNFGGTRSFEFSLPANINGNYLEITNFSYGSTPPVLYDLTNRKRYVANVATPSIIKIALEPSATDRQLILVSEDALAVTNVTSLQQRNFVNYGLAANQGDYLMITHPYLLNGSGGSQPVEDYKAYRSSAAGGGYNVKLYMIDELVDQFGLGIKMHPLAVRNFIRWARANYSNPLKHILLIGKGIQYIQYRLNENNPDINKLAFVPTFGHPASDILLAAEPGPDQIHKTPIGRLAVINGDEITVYLNKLIQYEQAQASQSPLIQDKAWMKNVVHVVGASDEGLTSALVVSMDGFRRIITDTMYGGNVTTFSKTTAENVQLASSLKLQNLFQEGVGLVTYFGHSSATTLEFNLDNPQNYNNPGKYPVFVLLGCNAGSFYNFNPLRLQTKETISEKFVFAQERGSIATIASTHLGVVHYLDIYNTKNYIALGNTKYGQTIGEVMIEAVRQVFNQQSQNDYYARFHTEQSTLHGDPALRINSTPKPDYVIEDQLVKINPAFISVADLNFKVDAKFMNIGKAINKDIVVEVKRTYPNNTTQIIRRDTIPGIRYIDSMRYTIGISPTTDKGLNKITITIDADNAVDELYETNNSITKEFFIFEDEARPVYPYNYAIVNTQNIKFQVSTANPFSPLRQYTMEIDTTELFNSPAKVVRTTSSPGGVITFDPGLTFTDSTVYFWRVSPVPASGAPVWNTASFIYLPNSDVGFNQSHFHQHTKSELNRMYLDSATRTWQYTPVTNNLFLRMGTWVTSGCAAGACISVSVNGDMIIQSVNWFSSLVFNVFHPASFVPWENQVIRAKTYTGAEPADPYTLGEGRFGSTSPENITYLKYNFEFRYTDTASRRKMMDFMRDSIPDGYYVSVRNFTLNPAAYPNFPVAWAADWANDQSLHGPNQSLYHYLKNAGFGGIDSFYRARPWGLVYRKNDPSFTAQWVVGDGVYDNPVLSVDCISPDTLGYIYSPQFGRAKQWKELKWRGSEAPDITPGDMPTVDIVGIRNNGTESVLYTMIDASQQDFNISGIDAVEFPYVKLRMRNIDSIHYTPYQMRYWRLTYEPSPEGAVAPNLFFMSKDTVEIGEPFDFGIAFKNVSPWAFDSVKVKLVITDRNNVATIIPVPRRRPLAADPDTIQIRTRVETHQFPGINTMYVEVNPDNDQPEQFHFNNFAFRDLYVKPDSLNPLLDVTFDGVHILNRDIVSSKPDIVVKLKDEAKWMILDDTSLLKIQVRYPDGSIHRYFFNNDTLQFLPAGQAPNPDNTATINFKPHFLADGEYELIVSGKDRSENTAGNIEYRVAFQVINKPMISNMLNYPNPFTTSTAFVFTITGSEVPQNIRIQIMTITGKIVRDITKDELGPLRIGRNITDFKWDGTDQYGQKLANGIYLYRVITNLNGKSLDKYKAEGDNTDKYFNKGYGKMYLMR